MISTKFVNDGVEIKEIDVNYLPLESVSISKGKYVYNFVGIIFFKETRLFSFPKHFNILDYSTEELEIWMKKILHILNQYEKSESTISGESDIQTSLPVDSIEYVVEYYRKYGLHTRTRYKTSKNSGGRPDFLSTIRKSPKLVSGDNLVFLDLYSKKKVNESTLLSQCMLYILDYVNKNYADIFGYNNISSYHYDEQLFRNTKIIIEQLEKMYVTEFKDLNKNLINSLLSFFKFITIADKSYHYFTQNFDNIWEKMVGIYLNKNFKEFNNGEFVFEKNSSLKQFKKKTFTVGKNRYGELWSISIDHYCDDEYLYIFDSKYYKEVNNLNYKQIVYALYCYQKGLKEERQRIINALIIPSENNVIECVFHIEKDDFSIDPVYEIYLPIYEVIDEYEKSL